MIPNRSSEMRIREATLADAAGMGRVMVESFLAAHRGQIPDEVWHARRLHWTPECSAQAWERSLGEIASAAEPGECIYVAEAEGGEVVGVAMGALRPDAAGTTGEIGVLYVLPERQRQGIGRRLFEAVAAWLAGRGVTALEIGVLKANVAARAFYEALGGQVVGEREFEDEGVPLPGVVYGWPDITRLRSPAAAVDQAPAARP